MSTQNVPAEIADLIAALFGPQATPPARTPGTFVITTLALPTKDEPNPKPMSTNYDLPSREVAQDKAVDLMRQRPHLASAFVCEVKDVVMRDGLLGMDHATYSARMDKRINSARAG